MPPATPILSNQQSQMPIYNPNVKLFGKKEEEILQRVGIEVSPSSSNILTGQDGTRKKILCVFTIPKGCRIIMRNSGEEVITVPEGKKKTAIALGDDVQYLDVQEKENEVRIVIHRRDHDPDFLEITGNPKRVELP